MSAIIAEAHYESARDQSEVSSLSDRQPRKSKLLILGTFHQQMAQVLKQCVFVLDELQTMNLFICRFDPFSNRLID
jgi:hypothetical protein